MGLAEAKVALAELEDRVLRDCPQARRRPLLGRRLTKLGVIEIAADPDVSTEELRRRIHSRYQAVYGNPVLVAIFVEVIISVMASIISKWILEWWENRHKDDEQQDDAKKTAEIGSFMTLMSAAALDSLQENG